MEMEPIIFKASAVTTQPINRYRVEILYVEGSRKVWMTWCDTRSISPAIASYKTLKSIGEEARIVDMWS